jgi:hypothetical protein
MPLIFPWQNNGKPSVRINPPDKKLAAYSVRTGKQETCQKNLFLSAASYA